MMILNPIRRIFSSRLWLIAGAFAIAGCSLPQAQPDLTRYFVLTLPAAKAAPAEGAHLRVALRAIQLPSYLRSSKAMQVRVASNEITYADESRWAEGLEAGIGRVLRDGLEGRGPIAHVVASLGEDHDFEILVTVIRCEGDREAGVARFVAQVEIFTPGPDGVRRARETFTTEIPGWDRQGYGQLAQKLSEAIDGFSDRVASLVATVK
ncbi:MAG: hypothetical protein JWM88_3154 [Verrucomicrobia bacterium]|nr:hypothetical protein [Verrucomicrobiota bacterium]